MQCLRRHGVVVSIYKEDDGGAHLLLAFTSAIMITAGLHY